MQLRKKSPLLWPKNQVLRWLLLVAKSQTQTAGTYGKSTHFTEYQAEVKNLIEKRDVKVLFRDTLASQGAIVLD